MFVILSFIGYVGGYVIVLETESDSDRRREHGFSFLFFSFDFRFNFVAVSGLPTEHLARSRGQKSQVLSLTAIR